MITYVDTSSLLKLLVDEEGSARVEWIWDVSDVVASVALVSIEARAALAAALRGKRLTGAAHRRAKAGLALVVDSLMLVDVSDALIERAGELADRQALRAYDSVHLASAELVGARVMASADADLCDAAARLGMHVANPLDA